MGNCSVTQGAQPGGLGGPSGVGEGTEAQEGGDTCITRPALCCRAAETNTTL